MWTLTQLLGVMDVHLSAGPDTGVSKSINTASLHTGDLHLTNYVTSKNQMAALVSTEVLTTTGTEYLQRCIHNVIIIL